MPLMLLLSTLPPRCALCPCPPTPAGEVASGTIQAAKESLAQAAEVAQTKGQAALEAGSEAAYQVGSGWPCCLAWQPPANWLQPCWFPAALVNPPFSACALVGWGRVHHVGPAPLLW